MKQPTPEWFPFAFALVFPVWMALIMASIARFSGWTRLARMYGTTDSPRTSLKLTSARMGSASYNNCIRVGFSPDGIDLRMAFFFRPFHPPLLIPWPAVRSRTQQTKWKFWHFEVLEIEADPPVKIALRITIPRDLLRTSAGGSPTPPMVQVS